MPILISVKAKLECEDCGTQGVIDLDPAEVPPEGSDKRPGSLDDLVWETVRGGGLDADDWTCYDDRSRCKECTGVYLDRYIKEHPLFVNGVGQLKGGRHRVTTYGGRVFTLAGPYAPPETDTDITKHPAWPDRFGEET